MGVEKIEALAKHAPKRGKTQAQRLIDIASEAELFHTDEGVAFADVVVDGRRETWSVMGREFADWLIGRFFDAYKSPPNSEAFKGARNVIAARARLRAVMRPVYTRVARTNDGVLIDLCDDARRAVEITSEGWRIVDRPAIRFRRTKGMTALPMPERGGNLDVLRQFLNVDDDGFILVKAYLLAALGGCEPFPILVLGGQQGSTKSTLCQMMRDLIDPNVLPPRAPPASERDAMIAAKNSYVITLDNVSHLPAWLSNALCRLSTGGGFSTRLLYSDDDENLFTGTRPAILSGIANFVVRPDLADRCLFVVLPPVDDAKRRHKGELLPEFYAARPKILGALCDIIAAGLRALPTIKLANPPRMADFAVWIAACATVSAAHMDGFERVYAENRASGQIEMVESDPVGNAVVTFASNLPMEKRPDGSLNAKPEVWTGTAAGMLEALNGLTDEFVRKNPKNEWPRTPRALGGKLRELAPGLAQIGVRLRLDRKSNGRHVIDVYAKAST